MARATLLLCLLSFFLLCSSCNIVNQRGEKVLDRTKYCSDSTFLGPLPWKQNSGLIIGDRVFDAGVAFRVWAPNADSGTAVVVPMGDAASRWQQTSMTKNTTDGTFYVNIGNAQPGDQYTYEFTYKGGSAFTRLDPRAQGALDVTGTNEREYIYEYEHGGIRVRAADPVLDGWESSWKASVVQDPDFDWGTTSYISIDQSKVIVYEMHIPTFNAVNGQAGTFQTAIDKLDNLVAAGITAVELMPTAAFSGDSRGWGYNPCLPFSTQNAFGGYSGLKQFVKEANSRGLAVLLDLVWNHMDAGSNILYRYDGYDGGNGGNGIYFYNDDRANTPWGPRPSYDTPEVFQYITDSVTMWINEYHISGFRWDSTVCIRLTGDPCYYGTVNIDQGWKVMQQSNVITLNAKAWSTAEDTKDYLDITLPTTDLSAGLPGAPGGAGFNDQWEETFYYTLEPGLVLANNSNLDGNGISKMITVSDSEDPHRTDYTENHDKASNQQNGRIPGIVDPGGSASKPSYWASKKATMGIGLVMTCSGVPMLFYGQEFLTYAKFDYPVPPNIDWSLATTNAGIVKYVSDLSKLRLNKLGTTPGLSGDQTTMLQLINTYTEKVFVFDRFSSSSDHVVVVANMYQNNYGSFALQNFPSDGTWYIRFNGDSQSYSSQFGNYGSNQTSITISGGKGSLILPSYSIVILSK